MSQNGFLAAIVLAAGALASCTIGGNQQATTVDPAPPPIAPQPTPKVSSPTTAVPLGLIAPTDPNLRLKAIKAGRADPFSPVLETGRLGFNPALNADIIPLIKPVALSPGALRDLEAMENLAGLGSGSSSRKKPTPQPTQALAVKVFGVVLVGGVPKAIIRSPDERVTRTVAAGDRISNGSVLVRAIEIGRAEPVVILEQYGIRVEAPIGGTAIALASLSDNLPPLPPAR
jgi:hypothetical protein